MTGKHCLRRGVGKERAPLGPPVALRRAPQTRAGSRGAAGRCELAGGGRPLSLRPLRGLSGESGLGKPAGTGAPRGPGGTRPPGGRANPCLWLAVGHPPRAQRRALAGRVLAVRPAAGLPRLHGALGLQRRQSGSARLPGGDAASRVPPGCCERAPRASRISLRPSLRDGRGGWKTRGSPWSSEGTTLLHPGEVSDRAGQQSRARTPSRARCTYTPLTFATTPRALPPAKRRCSGVSRVPSPGRRVPAGTPGRCGH